MEEGKQLARRGEIPPGQGPACSSWDFQKKEQSTPYDRCGSFLFSLLCLEEMNEERDRSG